MTLPVETIAISVLIRTFNSARTLDRVLSKLKLNADEEYVVVDSGSTDSTLAIAEAHGARIVQPPAPFNYSKSLNYGFRAARNPWVLVISSHSVSVVPDLLEVFRSVAREFSANTAVGYGPNSLNGRGPFDDDQVRYYSPANIQDIYPFSGNGNALYRRSVWEVIPFDEGIRTGEDKEWLNDILQKGFQVAFVAGACTINITRYSLRYMFMKGYSDIRALPHQPKTLYQLMLGLGSLTKKFLKGGMPVGSWIRYAAHNLGQYFGSFQEQDNTPLK